jgi:signal transduction histidine kinase
MSTGPSESLAGAGSTPLGPDLRARWSAFRATVSRVSPRARDIVFVATALTATAAWVALGAWTYALVLAPPLALLVLLAASVSLWWRRRYPVAVTLTGHLAFASTGLPVIAAIGTLTLAIRRRDRVLAVVSGLGFVVAVLSQGEAYGLVGELAITWGLGLGLVIALGAFIGARRDLVTSLRGRAEQAEAEREIRVEQARLGERARIAGEMHDVLAHKVSLIVLHAGALEVNPAVGSETVERTAALVRGTAREALEDLRRVLGVLRTDGGTQDLAPQPGLDQVPALVAASRAAGVRVDLEQQVSGSPPEVVGRTAHRVVQEALTNVHKHARSAVTLVRVAGRPGAGLEVSVRNLLPISAEALLPGNGMGLVGLTERVVLVGGELVAGRTLDGGWQVLARLPWPARPAS